MEVAPTLWSYAFCITEQYRIFGYSITWYCGRQGLGQRSAFEALRLDILVLRHARCSGTETGYSGTEAGYSRTATGYSHTETGCSGTRRSCKRRWPCSRRARSGTGQARVGAANSMQITVFPVQFVLKSRL